MDETKKDAAPFLCGFAEERRCAICGEFYPLAELRLVKDDNGEIRICDSCEEELANKFLDNDPLFSGGKL